MTPLDDVTIALLRRLDRAIVLDGTRSFLMRAHVGGRVRRRDVADALAGRPVPSRTAERIRSRVRMPSFRAVVERRERERQSGGAA